MREYVSECLVLSREPVGEFDARFSLYAKRYGKLVAKSRSVRKITSKLAGHLEPGNIVFARFVEKTGLQVVDALKTSQSGIALADLARLDVILAEREPDLGLWNVLQERFAWPRVLAVLGWDPGAARCSLCDAPRPVSFRLSNQEFFCGACSPRIFSPVEIITV